MEHVSYGYEGRGRALRDVSLRIPRGSVVALVGLSGCGKSTTASLLMRFCDPDAGRIFIDGRDYLSLRPEELRRQIAMVPQQVNLFSGTIRENLQLADPDADDAAMMEALREAGLVSLSGHWKRGWIRMWATQALPCPEDRGRSLELPARCYRKRNT